MRAFFLSLFCSLALIFVAAAGSYAQGVDRGAADAIAQLDAGVAIDAAPLPSQVVPDADAAVHKPAESLGAITQARRTGGLWAAVAVVLLIASRIWIRYTAPAHDAKVDPTGWRTRSLAAATAVALLAATGADILLGPTPLIALLPVAPTAIALVVDAINPKRGSARNTATT